jgi:hypothetical protein
MKKILFISRFDLFQSILLAYTINSLAINNWNFIQFTLDDFGSLFFALIASIQSRIILNNIYRIAKEQNNKIVNL